jgi:hypothetical protein
VTEQVQVAGRQATRFQMKTFELVTLPHDRTRAGKDGDPIVYEIAPPSKKVIMEEQYVVIPATKGYFVLHYRAPVSAVSQYQAAFDRVTASFVPLDKQ